MIRVVVFGVVTIACVIALPWLSPTGRIFPLVSGAAVGAALPFIDALIENRRHLNLLWYSIRYRKQLVRISLCYLFRIKLDDTYLLIQSQRAPVYLPVGGVYKVAASAASTLGRMGVLSDNFVPIDAASQGDLRIRVPGSHLVSFMRWFDGGMSREVAPWREFHEELIDSKILEAETFGWVSHEYLRRESTPVRFSHHAQSLEMIVADVFDVHPTDRQLAALRQVKASGHPALAWVTEDQIRRRGALPGVNQQVHIAEPVSQWII